MGHKKGAKYKPEQARKDAIHAILFSGIFGGNGCTTQPPILNKTEEQENFKTIEKQKNDWPWEAPGATAPHAQHVASHVSSHVGSCAALAPNEPTCGA